MFSNKLRAGTPFPTITATLPSGEVVDVAIPDDGTDWKLVLIYRGRHCPICTRYLNELEGYIQPLRDIGISVIAVSGDSKDQLLEHQTRLTVNFPMAYGLTEAQMHALGVYISLPRSAEETDHNFAEPALFIINEHGTIQVVDLSNNPFVRPHLEVLLSGLTWIRDPANHYPIRGTAP